MTVLFNPQNLKPNRKILKRVKVFSSKDEQLEVAEGCRTAGIGCIDCKKVLIKNLTAVMEPIWERRSSLLDNPDTLEDIISAGSAKAQKAANATMEEVRDVIGLLGLT